MPAVIHRASTEQPAAQEASSSSSDDDNAPGRRARCQHRLSLFRRSELVLASGRLRPTPTGLWWRLGMNGRHVAAHRSVDLELVDQTTGRRGRRFAPR